MNILLDTHILLWHLEDDTRLSNQRSEIIESQDNQMFLSIASLWEIAIKRSIGKLPPGVSLEKLVPHQLTLLDINISHLQQIETLPFHHRDPFDRLLIAQAIIEDLVVMTDDKQFEPYPIRIV